MLSARKSKVCHICRERHLQQVVAVVEGITFKLGQRGGKGDLQQTLAALEGTTLDGLDAFLESNMFHLAAIESVIFDGFQRGWQRQGSFQTAVLESIGIDGL